MLKEQFPASSGKQTDLTDLSALNYILGIYGIPYSAGSVLKIEPATGGLFSNHWRVALEFGGKGIETVKRPISLPLTGQVSTIGDLEEGDWKWHGGSLALDGAIYGIPAHAESVLKIQPETGEVKTIGPQDGGFHRIP